MDELIDAKVLIIDDDMVLSTLIKTVFITHGANATVANNGKEGLRQLYAIQPDLVVLDVRMPGMNGWDTCTQIREVSDVPVIMLTTMRDDQSQLRGYDAGVDDYLTKPFSNDILIAHARAVLRRHQRSRVPAGVVSSASYSDGNLQIYLDEYRVVKNGEPIRLTSTEFNLLAHLVRHANTVCSYEQILSDVWGDAYRDSPDYVHVYMSHLRRKLEPDSRNPVYLITEHGVGCRFVAN